MFAPSAQRPVSRRTRAMLPTNALRDLRGQPTPQKKKLPQVIRVHWSGVCILNELFRCQVPAMTNGSAPATNGGTHAPVSTPSPRQTAPNHSSIVSVNHNHIQANGVHQPAAPTGPIAGGVWFCLASVDGVPTSDELRADLIVGKTTVRNILSFMDCFL